MAKKSKKIWHIWYTAKKLFDGKKLDDLQKAATVPERHGKLKRLQKHELSQNQKYSNRTFLLNKAK